MAKHPQITDLAIQFFSRFARFEYALKQAGFRSTYQNDAVKADWEKFGHLAEVAALFDEMKSNPVIAYIIKFPPKRRIFRNGSLQWEDCEPPNDTCSLLNAMKRARNNLFHGDKGNPGLSRNEQLFLASIAVLEKLLDSQGVVRSEYEWEGEIA